LTGHEPAATAALMESYLLEWLQLGVRWLHMIAGIAWIGASFYFVWLNNNVRNPILTETKGLRQNQNL
jgi:uncharacterized membrane protein